jgi:UDP-N-acetylglucosamine 2-epimerase
MRVLTVFGTRPEAIKLAPIILGLRSNAAIQHFVCVTGQHRQMLDQVLQTFEITPDYDLNIMRPSQDLAQITAIAMPGINTVLEKVTPDWVLVQGDTTTAFVAALAAFYRKVKIGHVEAGLRTGNIHSPWPEEANRKLISQLATLHFAPTERAAANLRREGVPEEDILVTGNTAVDALEWVLRRLEVDAPFAREAERSLPTIDENCRLILVTGHRRENFDGGLERVCNALLRIAERGDVEIVYPVHLNPRVQAVVRTVLGNHPAIHLIKPIDYVPFIAAMRRAYLIVTDSGGIQEEAPSLRKPVLVTRDTTERAEAVEAGSARLVGTDVERLVQAMNELLDDGGAYACMTSGSNPFGDGKAADRIISRLINGGGFND